MSISIRGIRIENVTITRDSSTGENNVTGDYSLISTADKVLAKQGFNGYNEIKLGMSADTVKALNTFLKGIKNDMSGVLGLEEEQ